MSESRSEQQRSANMRAVKSRDTGPERTVRSLAHRMGYRFRIHRADLPGKPDLAFPSRRAVVFVHGCFWHHHDCSRGTTPKTRAEFWAAKLAKNVERDAAQLSRLKDHGWRALVIWECELKDGQRIADRLKRFLDSPVLSSQTEGSPDE